MANPNSQYTSNLNLELIYEGTKVDNDLFNDNFTKIDTAHGNHFTVALIPFSTTPTLLYDGSSSKTYTVDLPTPIIIPDETWRIKIYYFGTAWNNYPSTTTSYTHSNLDLNYYTTKSRRETISYPESASKKTESGGSPYDNYQEEIFLTEGRRIVLPRTGTINGTCVTGNTFQWATSTIDSATYTSISIVGSNPTYQPIIHGLYAEFTKF